MYTPQKAPTSRMDWLCGCSSRGRFSKVSPVVYRLCNGTIKRDIYIYIYIYIYIERERETL
jgi:hypothetical protein